jgi:hypothetical protein
VDEPETGPWTLVYCPAVDLPFSFIADMLLRYGYHHFSCAPLQAQFRHQVLRANRARLCGGQGIARLGEPERILFRGDPQDLAREAGADAIVLLGEPPSDAEKPRIVAPMRSSVISGNRDPLRQGGKR